MLGLGYSCKGGCSYCIIVNRGHTHKVVEGGQGLECPRRLRFSTVYPKGSTQKVVVGGRGLVRR